jgi:hypothetical protein
MKNIPTAEGFLNKKYPKFEDLDKGDIWDNIEKTMIEFAKLHVEAALKAASYKADEKEISSEEVNEYYRSKIINAYPLENIK